MNDKPNPGSAEALYLGCKCPRMDNHHGAGRYGDGAQWGWFISGKCPLHKKVDIDTK